MAGAQQHHALRTDLLGREPAFRLSLQEQTHQVVARTAPPLPLGALFAHYRDRLRMMVRLRLDRRVVGRLDASDVLQEAYLDMARRFSEYAAAPAVPFYVWLRGLTGQRLIDLHRQHLGTKMRDAGQEVSLNRGGLPQASSASLAQQLLAGLTSPTQAAIRAEMQLKLQDALNSMDPIDREVVVLRHFEELNNIETAAVLGIEPSAASKRYLRAIRRLKAILNQIPGFFA
jgi:RNA polymerase sigma-70 factor (ECF subfamily)